ncbi:DUF6113 family protein [Streptomyces gardneri]|uniref:Integral membrane protein n=1 Tax=Streptomyces gardneri TaxID=66892 RepID=A0A4Y3S237_9ACTN|nr:DUF6113 family protein [Streptomyces gardneri]GEB62290.1 hypothetical protein SGA01_78950 [Streptomyces gardneri]GHG86665.1 hypothetical protein GCM10017674_11710 [Streptomyces gardneri]
MSAAPRASSGGSSRASSGGSPRTPAPAPAPAPLPTSRGARYAWYGVLVVLGALVGGAGALVQAAWFPAGLLLGLLASAAVFYGGLRATGAQVGVVAAGMGWLVAVIVLSFGRPEGDGVFGGGGGELLFLFGGMAIAVICATLSRLPRPTP